MPEMSVLISLAAVAVAVAYLPFIPRDPSTLRSVLKTLPVLLLALAALSGGLPPLVLAALAACAAGDYFLSLEGENNFLSGLGAFLAGHLFYIAWFAGNIDVAEALNQTVVMTALILAALSASVLARLWPFLDSMKAPVTLYAVTIGLMALFAKAAQPPFPVLAGVGLFVVSDIILALDRFTPLYANTIRRAMPFAVWILYFSAQFLIVFGMLSVSG